ncbi:hypothetical protein OCU04_004426 [Sclerotinia nivalis]|uniref:Uncharacterized protein n=1 Tax=Sclerotinia nivalis TaxID=352851 RepID=A0A9X0AQG5_9HELO|nr:hypothetical protein OCU04_004426 [Sclerotinia nivalis]
MWPDSNVRRVSGQIEACWCAYQALQTDNTEAPLFQLIVCKLLNRVNDIQVSSVSIVRSLVASQVNSQNNPHIWKRLSTNMKALKPDLDSVEGIKRFTSPLLINCIERLFFNAEDSIDRLDHTAGFLTSIRGETS